VRLKTIAVSLALLCTSAVHAQPPATPAAPPSPAARPGSAPADAATTFVVKFKVKAGKEADFEHAFQEMSQGVREHEPGNIYYELYHTADDPQAYVVVERYKDAAAIAAHGRSPHGQKLFGALRDLTDGPPQVQRLIFVLSK